jgi:hypothetical protein
MTAFPSNAHAGLLRVEERTHANNQLLAPSFLNFTTIRVILSDLNRRDEPPASSRPGPLTTQYVALALIFIPVLWFATRPPRG